MKNIALLGATGSIGGQTIEVVKKHKDKFNITTISIGSNVERLAKILEEIKPEIVCVKDGVDITGLKNKYQDIKFVSGKEGIKEVVTRSNVDMVVTGISGFAGLYPTVEAIKAKKDIALSNKETLVVAGHIVMGLAKEYGVKIIPVDSEHSAIFQSLAGEKEFKKIILTASGGAFRDLSIEELQDVTVKDALNHPNWSMGKKITIDSATMMNKALEIIEARWLFDTKNIDVLIHRESIVHSMVEFKDNSTIAQLGVPSMILPIQYALSYPERIEAVEESLDWTKVKALNFDTVDRIKYQAIDMAYEMIEVAGIMPTIMNAANEVAVERFLNNEIKFVEIVPLVKEQLNKYENITNPTIEDIYRIDRLVRESM